MPIQRRGRGPEISPSTRGAIAYARNIQRTPLKAIQFNINVNQSTISQIARHANKQSQLSHSSSIHTENTAPELRSGRPPLLHQDEIDSMITLATSTYEWRRTSWIKIAEACGVTASITTIIHAFQEAGYGRYTPRYKPFLKENMREDRKIFCL